MLISETVDLESLMDFHAIWYEYAYIGTHSTIMLLEFTYQYNSHTV
jgi:hypothetical protein